MTWTYEYRCECCGEVVEYETVEGEPEQGESLFEYVESDRCHLCTE